LINTDELYNHKYVMSENFNDFEKNFSKIEHKKSSSRGNRSPLQFSLSPTTRSPTKEIDINAIKNETKELELEIKRISILEKE